MNEPTGRGEPAVSTVTRTQCGQPGERERIAFHFHQFDHGCYGDHCPESARLYGAWQTALASGQ